MVKRTRGRQRVKMKQIQNEDQLQVTFSRRRLGLFNMANELSINTGSQIALLVVSPSNKVYPFGCPDVRSVIDKYQNQHSQPLTNHMCLDSNQNMLNSELSLLQSKVEALKKQGAFIDLMVQKQKSKCELDSLIQELDIDELEKLLKAAKELDNDVAKEIHRRLTSSSQGNQTNVASGIIFGASSSMFSFN
ncbi:hypothetical protein M9H77_26716 [Catharanthus roseus]|uniref:Uncharacterized protein n=1 Tax=Catharanthus roseus TaxID=4058 RepID=A0ACC0AEQ6_CATRO|nr:hypothetical protein M9H77_26716 [Catharanthus roseus]